MPGGNLDARKDGGSCTTLNVLSRPYGWVAFGARLLDNAGGALRAAGSPPAAPQLGAG